MKIIEAYQADDGTIFKTEIEAYVHDEYKKYQPEIDAFIASDACKYNNSAHKKIVENTLIAWQFWKANGGIDQ